MIKRRNALTRNIWWLLAIVILAGVISNYFFIHHESPSLIIHPEHEDAAHAGPLLDIQSWQTTRGLKAFFLPIETLPIVDIQLIFNAGSAYDGLTPGIAQLTNQMLVKNTAYLSTDAIIENFESLGAQLGRSVTRDAAGITLRTLSFDEERSRSVDLLTHVLESITFTPNTLALEKQQLLTQLAAQAQSPQAQSMKIFYEKIYGLHPYATPVIGTQTSVHALNLEQVKDFYKRYYHINNATLIIVGNLNLEAAHLMAEQFDRALHLGVAAPDLPSVTLPAARVVEHIPFPSSQKHIVIGLPTLEKGNPDFFAFYVGNEILGGSGLSSQLFDLVREQAGLAYSVSSQILPLKQKGPFFIALQTRNDASDEALALVQTHLARFIQEGPSLEELEKTKKNISGQFLMAFNSNAAIAQNIAQLAFYGLPLDYYDHYLEKIDAVTLDDIKRVFNTYVGSQNTVTVTLGVDEKAGP